MANAPLPGILAEIEEIAGREAALEVSLALGGQSIHVPRPENMAADHPLAVAAGQACRPIAERFAGGSIYVPRARKALVGYLIGRGEQPRAIAARLGISLRAVQSYRHLR